jgi:hypothetical protein
VCPKHDETSKTHTQASSRTGLRFSYVGVQNSRQQPDAWLPRGTGWFDSRWWRFNGEFDAGHSFVSHGWFKGGPSSEFSGRSSTISTNSGEAADDDWDKIVMYHQGSQLTHGGVSMWNAPGYHRNASEPGSSPPILSGIERLELRRDGWASLRLASTAAAASGASVSNGSALTKPVALPDCPSNRTALLVNADLGVGAALAVEVVVDDGSGAGAGAGGVSGRTVMTGQVVGNGVRMPVAWQGGGHHAALHGRGSGAFRFWLQHGMRLYAWQLRCIQ